MFVTHWPHAFFFAQGSSPCNCARMSTDVSMAADAAAPRTKDPTNCIATGTTRQWHAPRQPFLGLGATINEAAEA